MSVIAIPLNIAGWTGAEAGYADKALPRLGSPIWTADFVAAAQTQRPDDSGVELGMFARLHAEHL